MNGKQGYEVKRFNVPTKRYCQVLKLKDKPELIAQYRTLHSEEHVWQEVMDGIHRVGILEMEIYICSNQLVMVVETPIDFEWDKAMATLALLPRQAEWEQCVEPYQECAEGSSSGEKWQLMERMFHLYK